MSEPRRVYLSSTLSDLEPEREAVREALQGRCLVIESYSADERSVRDGCLADVAGCDLYIGILGLRYGYCPDDGTKSITEMEFEEARDKGIPQLVFLKNEGAISAPWTDAHTWTDERTKENPPERIAGFRARITSRPAKFNNPGDLKHEVFKAYTQHVERRGKTGDLKQDEQPFECAPAGETALQEMLSAHLNSRWTKIGAYPCWGRVPLFKPCSSVLSPARLFGVCTTSDPFELLAGYWSFVSEIHGPGMAGDIARDADLREAVILMTVVAAEAYVTSLREELRIDENEPLSDKDPRIAAVVAAACAGFGIRLSPGRHEPDNVVSHLPIGEFGFEEGKAVVKKELYSVATRLVRVPPVDSVKLPDIALRAIINNVRALIGCPIVLMSSQANVLRDTRLRDEVRRQFGVPILVDGVPRKDVQELLETLRGFLSPVFEGILDGKPATHVTEP